MLQSLVHINCNGTLLQFFQLFCRNTFLNYIISILGSQIRVHKVLPNRNDTFNGFIFASTSVIPDFSPCVEQGVNQQIPESSIFPLVDRSKRSHVLSLIFIGKKRHGGKGGKTLFFSDFGPINKIGARENIKIKPAAQAQ